MSLLVVVVCVNTVVLVTVYNKWISGMLIEQCEETYPVYRGLTPTQIRVLSVFKLCLLSVLLFTRDMRLAQLIITKLVGFRGTPLILQGVFLQMTFCWHNAVSFKENFQTSYYKSD
jgi:hypothetical protein